MIIDTSALMALLNKESDASEIAEILEAAEAVSIAAPTLLEASIVADRADDPRVGRVLDRIVRTIPIEIEPFTPEHAAIAREAYKVFGRGSGHAAGLNFGDCIAYALAYAKDEPLLFKGNAFAETDIASAD